MDLTAIQAAITSLKTAAGIAKGILDAKSLIEVQGKVIELQTALLDAQNCAINATTSQLELQQRIRELEAQLKQIEDWGDQESRYVLTTPWRGAAQVYALKKQSANGEPPHFLCTNCFHSRNRVILNPTPNPTGWLSMVCPACRSSVATGMRGISNPKYAEEYSSDASD